MLPLLEKADQKKLNLLSLVFQSKEHVCSQYYLLEQLGITSQTLFSTADTIYHDIKELAFEDSIVFSYSADTSSFSLKFSEAFSLQRLKNVYLRRSTKFKLLDYLLHASFSNIQNAADFLHVSYVQARRIIKELNIFLEQYHFEVSSKRPVSLIGDELSIRLFYATLFLVAYGGEIWPFSSFSYFDISNILANCPKDVYISQSLDKVLLTHYYSAVHLSRTRQGFLVTEGYSAIGNYAPYSDTAKEELICFQNALKEYLPLLSEEELVQTTKILCSSLVALGSYSAIKSSPAFFFENEDLEKINFKSMALYILDRFNKHLFTPLSHEEREKFLYSIMCLNYRVLFFRKTPLELTDILPDYTKITLNKRKYNKNRHIRRLIEFEIETPVLEILHPYKEYLITQYSIIFDKNIHMDQHSAPITIAFLSVISNKIMQEEVLQYYSTYFNIKVSDIFSREVDLVISDVYLSTEIIHSLNIDQPIVYCHMRLVNSDYEKITTALSRIAKEKFKTKLG